MVWPVISTTSSFPSYHHIIKWLRVEREFWARSMSSWPGRDFREFPPDLNKRGSPQEDHLQWGRIADTIEGGWHLISWLACSSPSILADLPFVYSSRWERKWEKEREGTDRKFQRETSWAATIWSVCCLHFPSVIEILWKMGQETLITRDLSISTVGRKLRKFQRRSK